MNLFLLLGGIFLVIFFLGILLEKIRVPWIFAALILGLVFAFYQPFKILALSETFQFLAWLGMYFLLFWIGFELDLEKIKKLGKFIIKSTFFIIFFEAFFGSLVIHFLFGYSWFISILTALTFATVGEAVLIPILDEFELTKTKLGQSILGIGIFDDIIEVFVILVAVISISFLTGEEGRMDSTNILVTIFSLLVLFAFTFGALKLKKEVSRMKVKAIEEIFLLILAIFFLLVGLGEFVEAGAIGALLAGFAAKNFLPKERIEAIEAEIRTLTYGFFGSIFFFWVGIDTDVNYLIKYPLLIFLVILVAKSSKISASYLIGKKELGKKPSILMGFRGKIFDLDCDNKIFI